MPFHGRSELIHVWGNLTGQRYHIEILAPVVVPFFNVNRNVTIFQQDTVRCPTACVLMRYLDEQHIRVLPWPAFSPDLSPFNHLWDVFDRRINHCVPQNNAKLEEF